MATIPLDTMLCISLSVFGLGIALGIPLWVRNWRVRRGIYLPLTKGVLAYQTLVRWIALLGFMSTLSTVLYMASRSMPFGAFMALCIAIGLSGVAAAFRIDGVRARRHR